MHLSALQVAAVASPPGAGFGGLHGLIGIGLSGGILSRLAALISDSWFQSAVHVVSSLAQWAVGETWRSLSASSEPVLSGHAFRAEFHVMVIVAISVILPMLCLGIVQAIARQDGSELLRSALVRMPFAVVFTGVAVELVSLCLRATDEASAALLSAAGDPARRLFTGLAAEIAGTGVTGAGIGAALLVSGAMAAVAFVLWVELAVRSAAVAAATLFLPLALAGLAWPATTHWARRLGETIAGLVLMKVVVAGVLALAATAIGGRRGIPGIVEGVALLALATFTPFVLLRLIPMIESGAVAHLESAHHRATGAVAGAIRGMDNDWLATAGAFSQPEGPPGGGSSSSARIPPFPTRGGEPGPGGAGRDRRGPGYEAGKAARASEFQAEIDEGNRSRHGSD